MITVINQCRDSIASLNKNQCNFLCYDDHNNNSNNSDNMHVGEGEGERGVGGGVGEVGRLRVFCQALEGLS